MAVLKNNNKKNRFKLGGLVKKNGFDRWFFFFRATSDSTGEESSFFIELQVANPYLSPEKVCFSTQSKKTYSDAQLLEMISGNDSHEDQKNSPRKTSYVAIKVGIYGSEGFSVSNYFPFKDFQYNKKNGNIKVSDCFFSNSKLVGSVSLSKQDSTHHPEYYSSSGSFSWDLNFERLIDFGSGYSKNNFNWIPTGAKTAFSGNISVNGKNYSVNPRQCLGYSDKNWGNSMPRPFIHISTVSLASIISRKELKDACITIQGIYKNKICAFINVIDEPIVFIPGKTKYTVQWNCNQVTEINKEEILHWSASFKSNKYLVDIDISCKTKDMNVHTEESLLKSGNILKILDCGSATGEIRVFKNVKKSIEVIEHAQIMKGLYEYGVEDTVEFADIK